jgi:hypothetical protein
MAGNVDLAKAFQAVTKNLVQNQADLNKADEYNHDHGDNIVQVFDMITKAVKAKKGADVSEQLAYASQYLAKNNKSGSGQAYSQSLADAASQFKGQQLTPDKSVGLINALLGGGQDSASSQAVSPAGDLLGALLGGGQSSSETQPASAAGDLLGALLGGGQPSNASQPSSAAGDLLGALLGGGQPSNTSQSSSAAGDILGALLSGGSQSQNQQQDGVDSSQLLSMGVNVAVKYLAAKKQGLSNGEALVQALVSGSRIGQTAHRAQSANIIASTLLNLLAPGVN